MPCTTAEIVHGDVERGNRLTIQQTYQYVELGGNVMCDNDFYARQVATMFPEYVGPEIDNPSHWKIGNKYYYHYHKDDHETKNHIWFLGIPWDY